MEDLSRDTNVIWTISEAILRNIDAELVVFLDLTKLFTPTQCRAGRMMTLCHASSSLGSTKARA